MSSLCHTNRHVRDNFLAFLYAAFNAMYPSSPLQGNWHIEALCHLLGEIYAGQHRRSIINIPPRHLKSFTVSIAWPAWLLGQNPSLRIIGVSYSESISSMFGAACRVLMQTPFYRALFPDTIIQKGESRRTKFMTTEQGSRLSSSTTGSLIGEGADVIVIDDPHHPSAIKKPSQLNAAEEWFRTIALTRLNNKQTGIITLIMQRLHHYDLTGNLLRGMKSEWHHLSLPAIAQYDSYYALGAQQHLFRKGEALHPAREPLELLKELERHMGSLNFSAQYLQEPLQEHTATIKHQWIKVVDSAPSDILYYIQSWDTAMKPLHHHDYSACTTWGVTNQSFVLVNIYRSQLEFAELMKTILFYYQTWKPSCVLIEDSGSGTAAYQSLRASSSMPLISVRPTLSKAQRLASISPFFEADRVSIVYQKDIVDAYIRELISFPHGANDDMVDSTSQALLYLRDHPTESSSVVSL